MIIVFSVEKLHTGFNLTNRPGRDLNKNGIDLLNLLRISGFEIEEDKTSKYSMAAQLRLIA